MTVTISDKPRLSLPETRKGAFLHESPDGTPPELSISGTGEGHLTSYRVSVCAVATYIELYGDSLDFEHPAAHDSLGIFYLAEGRVGWEMAGGENVFLGKGSLTVHHRALCARSRFLMPLHHCRAFSLTLDLSSLSASCLTLFEELHVSPKAFKERYGGERPCALPPSSVLERLFAPLLEVKPSLRAPLLNIKVPEILFYLITREDRAPPAHGYPQRVTSKIREVESYLSSHLNERLTLGEVAARFAMNVTTLKEVFKAVFGISPGAYLKRCRMQEATRLLQGELSIAGVAAKLGYISQSKFTAAFKEEYGLTPTLYRRQLKEGRDLRA